MRVPQCGWVNVYIKVGKSLHKSGKVLPNKARVMSAERQGNKKE